MSAVLYACFCNTGLVSLCSAAEVRMPSSLDQQCKQRLSQTMSETFTRRGFCSRGPHHVLLVSKDENRAVAHERVL